MAKTSMAVAAGDGSVSRDCACCGGSVGAGGGIGSGGGGGGDGGGGGGVVNGDDAGVGQGDRVAISGDNSVS